MEASLPVRPLPACGVPPLATVTGNQKLRQLPVHLIVPFASCSGVYNVFPDWSVSTVPTPLTWRLEIMVPAPPGCVLPAPLPAADVEPPPLAQPASTPAAAAAARAATSGPRSPRLRAVECVQPVVASRAAGVDLLLMARYLLLTHCFFLRADAGAGQLSADSSCQAG